MFVLEGRGDPNKFTIRGPSSTRHLKWRFAGGPKWSKIECWLGSFVIFKESGPVLLRNPIFCGLQGGQDPLPPPSLWTRQCGWSKVQDEYGSRPNFGVMDCVRFSFFLRTSCKLTINVLIRQHIMRYLIWVCPVGPVCLCPVKRTLCLYGLTINLFVRCNIVHSEKYFYSILVVVSRDLQDKWHR